MVMNVGLSFLIVAAAAEMVSSRGLFAGLGLADVLQVPDEEFKRSEWDMLLRELEDVLLVETGYPDVKSRALSWPLKCEGVYKKMVGHTICMTDNPKLTKSGVSAEDKIQITAHHNKLRGQVEPPATDLMPLQWDERLAIVAEKWAKQCNFEHDKQNGVYELGMPVGQNIAAGYSSWKDAVQAWYDEIQYFRYGQDPKTYLVGKQKVGHFTQVVFNGAFLVGCGYGECPGVGYERFYVCNYAAGQDTMSTPYTKGTRCSACPGKCKDGLCDCGGRVCYNGGTLDRAACTCQCLAPFTGATCQDITCPVSENANCGNEWKEANCYTSFFVRRNCPYMCGLCKDECGEKKCLNGGTLNRQVCTCSCPKFYTGATCEKQDCPAYEGHPCGTSWPQSYCDIYGNVPTTCPYMCNICKSNCGDKKCKNNGKLNLLTCKCECGDRLSGELCETVRCDVKDESFCPFNPKEAICSSQYFSQCVHYCTDSCKDRRSLIIDRLKHLI